MAIVFPASPSVNDTFTEGSITYKWDGAKWIGLGITPADRLVEGSNSLEIDDSNNLIWTGNNVGIGTDSPNVFNSNADDLVISGTGHQGLTIRSGNAHDGSIMFNDTDNANQRGIIRYIHGGSDGTDTMAFHTSGGEAFRIDSSGRVLQGLTSAKFGFFNDGNAPPVHQIQGDNYYNTAFSIFRDGVGGSGPNFILASGRGAIVQDDDNLGNISFQGHDGTTELVEGAKIFAEVGGTPGSNNMPTDLVFNTNSGTSTSAERLRITSAGQLLIHHDTNVAPDGYESMLQLADDSYQGSSTVWKRAAGSSAGANPALILQKVRGADIDGQGAVSDSDSIGQIRFYGADGTTAIECGNISATVDNTTSTNNVPGKLVFKTAKLQAGSGSPVNPTQAMTIKANHNVEIHDGNIVFETAGTGIDFSATANAVGMSSELFDDYEEGTFTAVLNSNTNATVTNASINNTTNSSNASYTKVGRLVTVTCRFAALHVDARNNVLFYITGLPFTSWVGNATTACIGEQRGLYFRYASSAETTNMHHLYGYIGASTTTLSLGASKGSGPYSGWPATHDSASSIYLNLTIQYLTDT